MIDMFRYCSNIITTLNIRNISTTSYTNMFIMAATSEGSQITVNYTADTSDLVDNMIATGTGSVVKGNLIQ